MSTTAKILVVDDIPRNIKLLADILSVQGYDVTTAASGLEALQQIEQSKPDPVLLDVMMPGMDGYEVCRQVRHNPATAILPVVMVTALDRTAGAGALAGADQVPIRHRRGAKSRIGRMEQ